MEKHWNVKASNVSIHAPTRGATELQNWTKYLMSVSIHAPTRGATVPLALFLVLIKVLFQSTHPHGVRRPNSRHLITVTIIVSIHAPTRGATMVNRHNEQLRGVSIHAPTRGATLNNNMPALIKKCFNPRTHTGCDCLCNSILFISHLAIPICESIFNFYLMIIYCLIEFLIC